MKHIFSYLAVILLLYGTLFFVSCSKTGLQGPQGAAGKDGSQFVNTYLIKNVKINNPGQTFINLPVPAITANVLSNGAVLVYTDFNAYYNGYILLPITSMDSSGNFDYEILLSGIYVGGVSLFSQINVSQPIGGYTGDFKIVVIQGASVTELSIANPNVNFNDYNQVVKLFHLDK